VHLREVYGKIFSALLFVLLHAVYSLTIRSSPPFDISSCHHMNLI
jgi:hypothetical protein